jgi:glycosyltransferase involved in cell wall biosynthesis
MNRIVYFLPDVGAGVTRIVHNLLRYRPIGEYLYSVVLMHNIKTTESRRVKEDFHNATTIRFEYDSVDNVYHVYKRMAALVQPRDIIVGNDGYEIRMVAALKLLNPVVYIMHGDFKYYYTICRLNQDIIDCFIAYSSKIYKQLRGDLHHKNQSKVDLIYYPCAAIDMVHEQLAKPNGFKIIFAGTLNERKGAHLLWKIYNLLEQNIPSFTLEIIGDGPLIDQLMEHFSHSPNVLLPGKQTNEYVLDRLTESQVFLFPSFLEGLPNVLLEALSRGVVPVSSDLESGVRDIIEHGKNGLLVETGNVEGYARSIIDLYQDPEQLTAMKDFGLAGLSRFEPWSQARLYEEAIIKGAANSGVKKVFPKYPMGRLLNKRWIPNFFVRAVRKRIKHPKL